MSYDEGPGTVQRIAVLGTCLPRPCRIARFTTELAEALTVGDDGIECDLVAMTDESGRHAYGDRVRFEIAEDDVASYRRAAHCLNSSATDVLSVQHEYGSFGGEAGSHLLALLEAVRMPIVTTLHTVVSAPTDAQRRVLNEVLRLSSRVVVMSRCGRDLLQEVHGVPTHRIDVIPHGVHSVPSHAMSKAHLGFEGQSLLLTFGLISPDEGIIHVIEALPEVLQAHPETLFLIHGATHPKEKAAHAEEYRHSLELRADELGVTDHVVFYDRFGSAADLAEVLAAADICIVPYLNLEQVSCPSLALAVGAGKAVVSTHTRYARELLADGRGILVPEKSSHEIAVALARLLRSPDDVRFMGERAAAYGGSLEWPSVAPQYRASFESAHTGPARRRASHEGPRASVAHSF